LAPDKQRVGGGQPWFYLRLATKRGIEGADFIHGESFFELG